MSDTTEARNESTTGPAFQYRVVVPVLGVTLAFVALLESLSRTLRILNLASQSTCTFLTFLSVCLTFWSAFYLIRKVKSRSSIMSIIGTGAILLVVSQTLWLLTPSVQRLISPVPGLYTVFQEIAMVLGVTCSLFGLYLSALETERTKLRLQRDRQRLRNEIDERQRAEQLLRQNEVKYRTLVDAFPHASLIVSKGRIVFANPMTATMLRQESPQNLLGADPLQFVATQDRHRIVSNMRGRFLVGREAPETYEATLLRTNGKTFPAMVTVGMIPFMDSVASQIVVVDMTEQKRAEQALRESENRMRIVMEATSDGYWDFDVARGTTYHSPAWAAMLGYGPDEAPSDNRWWLERVHPDDRERTVSEFRCHDRGETPRYESEYRLITKDGRVIWALSRGRVVERAADGAPLRVVGTNTDISSRKQAEEALRQAYAAVELRVQERTASLTEANARLKEEIAERKRTEQSLRESQAQLADAQRIGRMGNWVQDLVTLELTWSDEIYRIFEISRDDFESTQQAFFHTVHPDDRQALWDLADKVYRGEAEYDVEHRIVVPGGLVKVVHEHAELVRDTDGTPLKLVGTVQDITERKMAEKAIENRLAIEELVATISTRFIYVALDKVDDEIEQAMRAIGTFVGADRARVMLFSPDQSSITRGYEWYGENSKPSLPLLIGRQVAPLAWSLGKFKHLDALFVANRDSLPQEATGERDLWRDLETNSMVAIPMAVSENLLGVFTLEYQEAVQQWAEHDLPLLKVLAEVLSGVLARTRAERAIRESEEKYRSLLEELSEAVYKYSLEQHHFEYLGPAAKDVFGYPAEQFLANPALFSQILHPECGNVLSALDSGTVPPMMEYRIIDSGGSVRWILQSNTLVYDSRGQATAVEGLARDVTQRREAEHEIEEHRNWLVEASKMSALGEMAASIAHEINNPLNIISGSAEQLQRVLEAPHVAPDVAPRLAEGIMRHVFRIKKIVQGMRTFTRDSSQDAFQESSIKTILEDSVILCQDRFASHGVSLVVAEAPEDLVLECRPTQVMEVLVNLLSNALHAVENANVKRVEVQARAESDAVLVCVRDTGPGVDAEIAGKIFEPLVTTKQHGKGTGLGLSISKRIVESHHGSITFARSEDTTCFELRLPRRQGHAPRTIPEPVGN